MPVEDSSTARQIRHELFRRYVDTTDIDVRIFHGVCYMRGNLRKLHLYPDVDLEHEAEIIRKIVRQKPGIRELIWEVNLKH